MSLPCIKMNTVNALIVDDVESVRTYQKMLLVKLGFDSVDTVCNGVQAKEQLQSKYYQVMLLDIKLPDTDGMSILRWVRENYPDIQVIMCTANSTEKNVREAISLGAKGFLAKPIMISNFLELLQRLGFDTTGFK
ncbi:response regulator [Paraneptunicella aestuarii]|uniref:response regulator n=1 Tax=Paraneptunicella aestuarii TaxID=2831148 RepID=UPI001E33BFB9|nr:response regulator [Paraneptunicella aestuarii]UAA37956.1 response regulator [Paraneptunicella aestuarii]